MSIFNNTTGSGTAPPITVEDAQYTKLIDAVGGNQTYIGEALPGSSLASAVWRIKLITETGQDIEIEWADGVSSFTKVWDDRLTYTYS
jgi:hypothetical protein